MSRPARITASRRPVEAPRETRPQCGACAESAAQGDLLCGACALALRPRMRDAAPVLGRASQACGACAEGRLPRWSVAVRRWVHDYRRPRESAQGTTIEQGADVCGADEMWRGAFPR